MKMGAWPAMAPETVRFVGQAGRGWLIAGDQEPGPRRRGSRGRYLRGASRGRQWFALHSRPVLCSWHPEAPGNRGL